jgi:hypothetical protein
MLTLSTRLSSFADSLDAARIEADVLFHYFYLPTAVY